MDPKIIQQNQQRKLYVKDVVGAIHGSMTNNQAPKVLEVDYGLQTKTNEDKRKGGDSRMSKHFTFVELCAGIGGVSFGLERVGGECVLAAEYDPQRAGKRQFAQEAYKAVHPDVPMTDDIFELKNEDVPDHDLLSFTTPCQSFSVAGKRGGFEDVRGTVYFECMRIAEAKKPKVIFMENVKGLVGHDKGKTLDTIVKVANQAGYRVDFNVVNSKFFGVPQNRERFFMVGIREDLVDNEPWENTKGSTIVPKGKRRIQGYDDVKTFNFDWPEQNEVTTRLVDVLETNVDERYYLSEEKTEQLVARLEEQDKEDAPNVVHNIYGGFKESKPRVFKEESPTIRTSAGGGHLPSLLEEADAKGCSTRTRKYAGQPEQLEVRKDDVGNSVTTVTKDSMVLHDEDGLPIREATKKGYAIAKEGDAVNYQFPGSKTRRGRIGKQMANTLEASSINQGVVESESLDAGMKDNATKVREDGLSSTLPASYYKGLCGQARPHVLERKYRIRKLTPLECFRLQGFDDSVHQTIVDAGISDSQRYKMAGNAVTVNVIEALGEKIVKYL